MCVSAAQAEHGCGDRGNHLNPGDRANYVTTWWLFHYHKDLAFCALWTNFVPDFERYLVRHPTYPSRQAKLLSEPPLTPSYHSPFKAPCMRSERSTSRADKGGNNSYILAIALHGGKRKVKHQVRLWQACISDTRQETSFGVILLAPGTDEHGTSCPLLGPCCSTGHPRNTSDRWPPPPLHLRDYSKVRVFRETSIYLKKIL